MPKTSKNRSKVIKIESTQAFALPRPGSWSEKTDDRVLFPKSTVLTFNVISWCLEAESAVVRSTWEKGFNKDDSSFPRWLMACREVSCQRRNQIQSVKLNQYGTGLTPCQLATSSMVLGMCLVFGTIELRWKSINLVKALLLMKVKVSLYCQHAVSLVKCKEIDFADWRKVSFVNSFVRFELNSLNVNWPALPPQTGWHDPKRVFVSTHQKS